MKNKTPKKKISLKEWTYIGRFNHAAKWCRRLCAYTLTKRDEKTFVREQKINLLAYLIIFIPIHILQVLVCLWDGGLREFMIFRRALGKDFLTNGTAAFARASRVWNNDELINITE